MPGAGCPGIRWTAWTLGNPAQTPAPGSPGFWRGWGEGAGKNLEVSVARGRPAPLARTAPSGALGRAPRPARRDPRCRRRGAARAVGAGRLPPSKPPASAAAFAPGGGPARREPGPLPARERAVQSALLAAVAAEAAAGLARWPPSARPAEATGAGAAGNFEKLSRSQARRSFEGKPRPRPTPSQIRVCGAAEGSQFPSQTAPGLRRGETGGRGPPAGALGPRSGFGEGRQRCWGARAHPFPSPAALAAVPGLHL